MAKKRKDAGEPAVRVRMHLSIPLPRELMEHHFAAVKLASLEGITHGEEIAAFVRANVVFLDAGHNGGVRRG